MQHMSLFARGPLRIYYGLRGTNAHTNGPFLANCDQGKIVLYLSNSIHRKSGSFSSIKLEHTNTEENSGRPAITIENPQVLHSYC